MHGFPTIYIYVADSLVLFGFKIYSYFHTAREKWNSITEFQFIFNTYR
jgi:hypothetical protein